MMSSNSAVTSVRTSLPGPIDRSQSPKYVAKSISSTPKYSLALAVYRASVSSAMSAKSCCCTRQNGVVVQRGRPRCLVSAVGMPSSANVCSSSPTVTRTSCDGEPSSARSARMYGRSKRSVAAGDCAVNAHASDNAVCTSEADTSARICAVWDRRTDEDVGGLRTGPTRAVSDAAGSSSTSSCIGAASAAVVSTSLTKTCTSRPCTSSISEPASAATRSATAPIRFGFIHASLGRRRPVVSSSSPLTTWSSSTRHWPYSGCCPSASEPNWASSVQRCVAPPCSIKRAVHDGCCCACMPASLSCTSSDVSAWTICSA
eukprot:Unigene10147_Nuclearia_a/m.30988 Unigene10147_Nuclearia_a/g.30988  ORF Unigene10147_Nuclearia_a/g.30988 Unigene10147_Nuclearia_a/m.30988 type:complete len:316 (-) Unigene10147_Nuclearia_a:3097-4044(-)